MSLGSQLIIGLALFLYIGLKIDQWLMTDTPITVWLFPLLFIVSVIIKTIIDTGKKK